MLVVRRSWLFKAVSFGAFGQRSTHWNCVSSILRVTIGECRTATATGRCCAGGGPRSSRLEPVRGLLDKNPCPSEPAFGSRHVVDPEPDTALVAALAGASPGFR